MVYDTGPWCRAVLTHGNLTYRVKPETVKAGPLKLIPSVRPPEQRPEVTVATTWQISAVAPSRTSMANPRRPEEEDKEAKKDRDGGEGRQGRGGGGSTEGCRGVEERNTVVMRR